MTPTWKIESLGDACGAALVEIGARHPEVTVLDTERPESTWTRPFGKEFPDRLRDQGVSEAAFVLIAAGLAREGRSVFASTTARFAAGAGYPGVRQAICYPRADVKILAAHDGLSTGPGDGAPPMVEDIGLMRGLPGMSVIVPADAPTTRSALVALAAERGPAYVRVSRAELPTVTDGRFELGRANEVRSGADLTIFALGALLAPGLEVAEDLHEVGIEARVLDAASVKPFDEPAVLRAARDTGAILVLEEHTVATGVGALVAATTAENYPVPVRRVGVPDLFVADRGGLPPAERYGLSRARIREEAWELLRARGKVQ